MLSKYFNFHDIQVQVNSNNKQILDLMEKNFSYFLVDNLNDIFLTIDVYICDEVPMEKIPSMISSHQTRNAIIYDKDNFRYCDYYGKGIIIFDKINSTAKIYCDDINFTHELTYLFLLSRVGKQMDLNGIHRVHACSFTLENHPVICMMPMKGGKSSLFLEMIKNDGVKFISDDAPLITKKGKVLEFPIRFGLDHIPKDLSFNSDYIFELYRSEFGKKFLFDTRGLSIPIYKGSKKAPILIHGKRTSFKKGKIKKISKYKMFFHLIKYLGVGLGLPIIIEHFLEKGFKDILVRVKITALRLRCIISLLRKSKCFEIYLGTDKEHNAKIILNYFGQHQAQ
ncbi:MAG: hypothetical protein N4A33_07480 [Bacteriovoracaceae bacterium]|jgi:hypothetical protein|nr:hypothetical protein [Bacteriovoracaceae bacterium]